MKNNKTLEEINTEEYRLLLKKHFNFNIIEKTNISEEELDLFNQYIDKKIADGHKHYDFGIHFNALMLQKTIFFYEIDGSLIGVCNAPNGQEYVIGYKLDEYYSDVLGTNISNWIYNFENGVSDKVVKDFMKECHMLYGTTMELYDPGEDDSNLGFNFN